MADKGMSPRAMHYSNDNDDVFLHLIPFIVGLQSALSKHTLCTKLFGVHFESRGSPVPCCNCTDLWPKNWNYYGTQFTTIQHQTKCTLRASQQRVIVLGIFSGYNQRNLITPTLWVSLPNYGHSPTIIQKSWHSIVYPLCSPIFGFWGNVGIKSQFVLL